MPLLTRQAEGGGGGPRDVAQSRQPRENNHPNRSTKGTTLLACVEFRKGKENKRKGVNNWSKTCEHHRLKISPNIVGIKEEGGEEKGPKAASGWLCSRQRGGAEQGKLLRSMQIVMPKPRKAAGQRVEQTRKTNNKMKITGRSQQ